MNLVAEVVALILYGAVGKSDGTPLHVDPEKTKPYCRACGSDDLSFWMFSGYTGHPLYRCNKCNGAVST